MSNPPFIKKEKRDAKSNDRFKSDIESKISGKADEYLLFIDKSLKVLKPGGIGLFVLPHSFLINNSASELRKEIASECIIKYIADLSAIPVFENTGIYVALLVFQKKYRGMPNEKAILLKCKNNVGRALEAVIKNVSANNNIYSIYGVDQSYFENENWFILSPDELTMKNKLMSHSNLEKYLDVHQGFVTGNDEIFTLDNPIANNEQLFKSYIPDKEINQFSIDRRKTRFVFYPFINGKKITETELKKSFPDTWRYLNKHKNKLSTRSINAEKWWEPSNPRQPHHILMPKIITPHLVFVPKFAVDITGEVLTSHSPYVILKDNGDKELLYYFLGILNSTPCFWYISTHSHKYGGSYSRLEVATLKKIPIPDPFSINKTELIRFINLVKQRLTKNETDTYAIDKEIEDLACKFYGLAESEIALFFGKN